MKNYHLLFFLLFITLGSCINKKTTKTEPRKVQENKPIIIEEKTKFTRNLIIYYNRDIGKDFLLEAVKNYGAQLIHDYNALGGISIKIPEDKSIQEAIIYFKKVKGVTSVHRDEIIKLDDPVK